MGKTVRWVLVGAAMPLALAGAAAAQTATPSPAAQAGVAFLQARQWAEAADAYRTVVAAEPDNGLAWFRLGRALVEMGEPEDGLEALGEVAGTGFQTPFLYVLQARAHAQLGRDEEALSSLEQVQPVAGMGGASALTGLAEFSGYVGTARFDAVAEAFETAEWPCRADPVSQQFDFWLGEWDVYVGGALAGHNKVESILGGCTVLENWTSANNREGKSFNWLDRSSYREPRWRQLWIADGGNTLDYYDGRYSDGAMRFEGHTFSATGDRVLQKLRFENLAPDTVRQVFEQSSDGGESWVVTFDGLYVRRGSDGS